MVSECIDINKTSDIHDCKVCLYCKINFNYQPLACNGCHVLLQICMAFNDMAIGTVRGNDYRILFWSMTNDKQ